MPTHSKSKSHGGESAPSRSKSSAASFAAGGANSTEKTRSAVTGRQLGRAAIRSINKNADAVSDYLDSVLSASSLSDLQGIVSKAFILGLVVRQMGAGRLAVTLQTGEREVNLPIKGVLRFKGRANTDAKKERGNTMMPGDFIIVDGGQAAGRLTKVQADRVRSTFRRHALPVPADFFAALEHEEEDLGGFAWDRSEEAAAEATAEEERKVEEARCAIVKAGGAGRGGAPRVSVRDAVAALAEREEGEACADRAEEEDDGLEAAAAAAAAAAEKPKHVGPNRAERRAAAARAREEAEAAAAAAAASTGFNLYTGADQAEEEAADFANMARLEPVCGDRTWEEAADDLDIDAI